MKMTRRVAPVLAVTAMLGLAVACAGGRNINPDTVTLLTCASQPGTVLDQKPIGQAGGFLTGNGNSFLIPGKALGATANFTMSQLAGDTVGIVIEGTPAPPALSRDATVFISFAHCTPAQVGDTTRWKIARLPNINAPAPSWKVLETGRTGNVLWGFSDHNSVFVILAD